MKYKNTWHIIYDICIWYDKNYLYLEVDQFVSKKRRSLTTFYFLYMVRAHLCISVVRLVKVDSYTRRIPYLMYVGRC